MEENTNNNKPNFSDTDIFKFLNKFKFIIIILALILGLGYMSYYTVDANEEAVIYRLGKYHTTVGPGLHFKLPLFDKVEYAQTGLVHKKEFGYETTSADVQTQYSAINQDNVSVMITNDPSIVEVTWAVQYRIHDAYAYLVNVKNVEKTILDLSEAGMRLEIGDVSFNDILSNRGDLGIESGVRNYMQQILSKPEKYKDDNGNGQWDEAEEFTDCNPTGFVCEGDPTWEEGSGNGICDYRSYDSGIIISTVKLQSAKYPAQVADSFDDVASAEKEKLIKRNKAEAIKIETINKALGDSTKIVNEAEGDVALFNALFKEYKVNKEVIKNTIYLETLERIYSTTSDKTIIDSDLNGVLPFLHLNEGSQ